MLRRRRSDLPFRRVASERALPLIVGLMVFLAALALTAASLLHHAAALWSRDLGGTLTVQVPPVRGAGAPSEAAARVEAALAALHALPQVESATPLERSAVERLLEPWLGKGNISPDLPVPALIDVRLRPDAAADSGVAVADLTQRLAAAVPEASVDDHGLWLDRLSRFLRGAELIAAGIVVLICLAAVAIIVFATRAGMATHHESIEILHLIGARDSYIARQFQGRALWLGLRGGVYGVVLAVAVVLVLGELAAELDGQLIRRPELGWQVWAQLAAAPLVTALVAMITARLTVATALRRLP